jgi:hypothetical protein
MDAMQDQESASPSVSVAVAVAGKKEEITPSNPKDVTANVKEVGVVAVAGKKTEITPANNENVVATKVEEKVKDVTVEIPKEAV